MRRHQMQANVPLKLEKMKYEVLHSREQQKRAVCHAAGTMQEKFARGRKSCFVHEGEELVRGGGEGKRRPS